MIRVKWCRECGRLGAYNFAYCPWCGKEFSEKPDAEEVVDGAFARIGEDAAQGPRTRMDRLERRLAELDRDLGDFLCGAGEGELDGHEARPILDHLPGGPRGPAR